MNDSIKLILSLSLSGSILAGLIFLIKPFIKQKFSKSIQYYIWIVVLLRFVLPFSFEGSFMNQVFYVETSSTEISTVSSMEHGNQNATDSVTLPNVQNIVANGLYNGDADHGRYFMDLWAQYLVYIWLLGVVIALTVNLVGYFRFLQYIRHVHKPATDEETKLLASLIKGKRRERLVRNPLVTSPMLVGIIKPLIIIPDTDFTENQLRNILLHETTHLVRYDIAVKWFVMMTACLHWFNPLLYFIKKEINGVCELSCDEAVIKNLKASEKQDYGDTLLAVVSETKYPVGLPQATMNEEKQALKERLVAIMQHNKKSKTVLVLSGLLVLFAVCGAIYLGASIGKEGPPNIYISAEDQHTKEAVTCSYVWQSRGNTISVDSSNPIHLQYQPANIVSLTANQQLVIGTQKLKSDKKYDFTVDQLAVYKDGKLMPNGPVQPSFTNGNLYLMGPSAAGEYIYDLRLKYKDKGTVNYGFVVRVDMLTYDLADIATYKTPYVGNASKVSALAAHLPLLDKTFQQQYISLKTKERPYGLSVYYEATRNVEGPWPLDVKKSAMEPNLSKNALVLFCMIDNLDEVTFAFRNTKSDGKLDISKYDSTITYRRSSFKAKYGDLTLLSKNLKSLQDALTAVPSK